MASKSLELFTIDLLKVLLAESKDGNIFYSPLSIMTAFTMLLLGTRNQSAIQILRALYFYGNPLEQVHEQVSDLMLKCYTNATQYDKTQLSIANGLFVQENFTIKADYKSNLAKYYKNEIIEVNFGGPAVVGRLNKWIEEKTFDKIKDMFQEGAFTSLTKLVLANAIYFKGNFKNQFPIKNTSEKPFHKDFHTEIKVQMMQTRGGYKFVENRALGLKALAIPFQNHKFSLLLVLPTTRFGLDRALTKSNKGDLKKLFSSLSLRRVSKLEVPKFKIDTQMDLKSIMIQLGVKDVFDESRADLTGISDMGLFVDKAVHKTFLDVNEHGVEAAAATALSINSKSMPRYSDNTPVEFIVDEPFLLSVYHNEADAIVFLGRVNNS